MRDKELIEKVNNRMIDFIANSHLHIDCFYMILSKEELEAYQKESLRIGDKKTSDKLLRILENK